VHRVPGGVDKARLQDYGSNIFNYCQTKSALKKALKKNLITVDGRIASTATIISGGEKIELNVPFSPTTGSVVKISLRVNYEDDYLAVVTKPPGILTSGNKRRTLANALTYNLTPSAQADACIPKPVHRLDYETSGLVLVGKTQQSIRQLNQLFSERAVEKTYYTVAVGEMAKSGQVDLPIDGKDAQTSYEVLESVPSIKFGRLNLVKVSPETGRHNQIRIHLKSINNPVFGDKKYGKEGLILKGKGLYLHAAELKFIHPFSGQSLHLVGILPRKFGKLFNNTKVQS